MKKTILFLMLGIFLITLVGATIDENTELPVKQGDCTNISQTCASCSYVNISSVSHRLNSTIISNVEMIDFGNGEWRYEFCDTNYLGRYDVKGQGDINGVDTSFKTSFQTSASGNVGTENIIFFLIILVLLYTLTLLFFFKREIELAPFTALSGMALGAFGIYMVTNGIIIYRDWFSNYLAYLTIGIGFGLALWSLISWIEDSM